MKVMIVLLLVVALVVGMSLMDGDSLLMSAVATPNPAQLTARAAQNMALEAERSRADSTLSAAAAAAEAVRIRQTEIAIEGTAAAGKATSMAVATMTQQAWYVTATAAVAQSTSTARAEELKMRWTQEAIDQQATNAAVSGQALSTAQAVNAGIAEEQLRQEQIRTDRAEITKKIQAALPYAVIGLLFGVTILGLNMWSNFRVVPRGADGSAPVMVIGGRVVNADRAIFPVTDPKQPVNPPLAAQLRVTENEQKVAAVRALSQGGRGQSASRVASEMAQPQAEAAAEPQVQVLPNEAPWESLSNWTGSGGLPLGIGSGKMGILLDPEKTPHLLVAGTSGSGKTMGGLRPVVTFALTTGWQVVLMNEAGGDFAPLKSHPNLSVVDDGPGAICQALEAVADEVERRSKILSLAGTSTYARLPNAAEAIGPRIMVVVDELVALAMQATGSLNGRIWQAAIHITSKGRKMGLMFVAATTDPTYRTLGKVGLIVRDNCGRLVFRLRDRTSSMGALDIPDAAMLGDNQFIAQLDSAPVRGVAFHPSDTQLMQFIQQRQAPALPKPVWLALGSGLAERSGGGWDADTIKLAGMIEEIWLQGGSKRSMAKAAGGEYAGAMASKIDQAIAYLSATTTPESGENAGQAE